MRPLADVASALKAVLLTNMQLFSINAGLRNRTVDVAALKVKANKDTVPPYIFKNYALINVAFTHFTHAIAPVVKVIPFA